MWKTFKTSIMAGVCIGLGNFIGCNIPRFLLK